MIKKGLNFFKKNRINLLTLFFYILFFSILFFPIRTGIGQFWDWTFPYFKENIHNIFDKRYSSWTNVGLGQTLSYSTDYFFRFIISKINLWNPETLKYILLISLFSISALVVFLITKIKNSWLLSFVVGLTVFINPAIFYKLTSGHFNYFVSYPIFLYIIYYLLSKFKCDLKSYIILSLLVSFVGVQIQFFIFTYIFIATYFVFNRSLFNIKYASFIFFIPILINSVWLYNFLLGANNVQQISDNAAKVASTNSNSTSFLNIFIFYFSKANNIFQYYPKYFFYFSILFFIIFTLLLLKNKIEKNYQVIFVVLLFVFIFLTTGFYNNFSIPVVKLIYPMFREVGHFTPLIVLFLFLSLSYFKLKKIIETSLVIVLLFFIFYNSYIYVVNYQIIDYKQIRNNFSNFENFSKLDSKKSSKILSYPFFSQYSFIDLPSKEYSHSFTSNVGYDSYSIYSDERFINNALSSFEFPLSLQFLFVKTHDLDILKPYNIGYIFDFSKIYESNYDKYVPSQLYENNINFIKNDPNFFKDLVNKNEGRIKEISPGIYQIIDEPDYITASSQMFDIFSLKNILEKQKFIETNYNTYLYKFEDGVSSTGTPTTDLTPLYSLFDDPVQSFDFSSSSVQFVDFLNLENSGTYSLFSYSNPTESLSQFYINGIPQDKKGHSDIFLSAGLNKFSLNLGSKKGENFIPNGSFEEGAWSANVEDCGSYDSSPDISQQIIKNDATDGYSSLLLSARRHTACSRQKFSINGGLKYIFSLDYKSPTKSKAGFYIKFNDKNKTVINQKINPIGTNYENYKTEVDAPIDATQAQLYLYAYESDKVTLESVSYDNLELFSLPDIFNKYYLVGNSKNKYSSIGLEFKNSQLNKKNVDISEVSNNFFLTLSEAYHQDWKTSVIKNGKYFSVPSTEHFKVNNFSNGWLIDIDLLCKKKELCEKNVDGSYNMNMVIEFWPENYFWLSLIISGITLATCLVYLFYVSNRRRFKLKQAKLLNLI